MRRRLSAALIALCLVASGSPAGADPAPRAAARRDLAAPEGMRRVVGGSYRPFYAPSDGERELRVETFFLDRTPVTVAEYARFLTWHPEWQRGQAPALFADDAYLTAWSWDDQPGAGAAPDQPVVGVSWFAAKAYCAARGARLPDEAEWEYAALASPTSPDGSTDITYREQLLEIYARPSPPSLPLVGLGPPNYWGIHDLHGLVWEWVMDFGSTMISVDNREGGGKDRMLFCGAGALSADDPSDYPTFMRLAFRSSLRGAYTTGNLGFRCARGEEEANQ